MRKLFFLIMLVGSCHQAMASGIYNPGSTGGSGSGIVSPGTFTWTNASGITVPNNLTISTGVTNLTQLSNLGGINGVQNANFDYWANGTGFTSPAAGTYTANQWQLNPNVSLSGSWSVVRVSTVTTKAQYSLQLITSGAANIIYGISQPVSNYYAYLGSSVTLTAWVNSNQAITISIGDGLSASTSTAHPGDSAWHQLNVGRFISTSATSLTINLGATSVGAVNQTTYYDGAMLVTGDTPVNFVPIPAGIVGVTDGSSATAGQVGEYIESIYSSVNAPGSGNFGDATSIPLTAGDWDVTHCGVLLLNGSTLTGNIEAGIGPTSGNVSPSNNGSDVMFWAWSTATNTVGGCISNFRESLTTSTTIYAKIRAVATGTPQFTGRLSARRMR